MLTAHEPSLLSRRGSRANIVLIADSKFSRTETMLRECEYKLQLLPFLPKLVDEAGTLLANSDIVLVDVTESTSTVFPILNQLNASNIGQSRPRLLCLSTVHRNPRFILDVEKCGARFVTVTDSSLLIAAVDLALAELQELATTKLGFRILHRYTKSGLCMPGEEISAVSLCYRNHEHQLSLGLAQRFVFNFLAQRRLAVDSQQIISGISSDRFYREHAGNSGYKQIKKIRRATIKVLIQRIRAAMATAFANASLRIDSREVLRSCLAEGSKRVLYKLQADVRFDHTA